MIILFDFDDVLNNLSFCWVEELNRRYQCDVPYEQVKTFDLNEVYPTLTDLQIMMPYLDGTLYRKISPVEPAQALIRQLAKNHEVYVVTANLLGAKEETLSQFFHGGFDCLATQYMLRFLWDYYPEIPRKNVIITPQKQLIKGDVLIDDNPEYLYRARCARILIDKNYNRGIDDERHNIMRAKNWDEVEKYITEEVYF